MENKMETWTDEDWKTAFEALHKNQFVAIKLAESDKLDENDNELFLTSEHLLAFFDVASNVWDIHIMGPPESDEGFRAEDIQTLTMRCDGHQMQRRSMKMLRMCINDGDFPTMWATKPRFFCVLFYSLSFCCRDADVGANS
jgi:hypothetical protein